MMELLKPRHMKQLLENFKNPKSEFRGAPFWAWNGDLDEKNLLWQIDKLSEMGFGGFFMHSRSGLSVPYMEDEFLSLVKKCVEYAKEKNMFAYLYDEDRWPSGSCGGRVTRDKKYAQQYLCFSLIPPDETDSFFKDNQNPILLAVYDIVFNEKSEVSYKRIEEDTICVGEKWYAYRIYRESSGWYNGNTYVDVLNEDAIGQFINRTHEVYKSAVGKEFGQTIPYIFSDEPNFAGKQNKINARDGKEEYLPWTNVLNDLFLDSYGYDLLDKLPELVWNDVENSCKTTRYDYYKLISELFAHSFCDKIGEWCNNNQLGYTGHVYNEKTLHGQIRGVGEAMRHYLNFTLPGIDMLCDFVELTTIKQAQSVAHQCGRLGIMSELYGVTGWEFDFRGHKFQGDWQAALGVVLRVPHLAWVQMKGAAKRDYPASIGYQSCWYEKYSYIENHYARLNTVLTRGKPIVKIAVLHPIESSWMYESVADHNAIEREVAEKHFQESIEWLLSCGLDFDYISESLLPKLYKASRKGFVVGEMCYQTIVVLPQITIRKTTLNYLEQFIKNGGKVVFCGNTPNYVDGQLSNEAECIYEKGIRIEYEKECLISQLEIDKILSIKTADGKK